MQASGVFVPEQCRHRIDCKGRVLSQVPRLRSLNSLRHPVILQIFRFAFTYGGLPGAPGVLAHKPYEPAWPLGKLCTARQARQGCGYMKRATRALHGKVHLAGEVCLTAWFAHHPAFGNLGRVRKPRASSSALSSTPMER